MATPMDVFVATIQNQRNQALDQVASLSAQLSELVKQLEEARAERDAKLQSRVAAPLQDTEA